MQRREVRSSGPKSGSSQSNVQNSGSQEDEFGMRRRDNAMNGMRWGRGHEALALATALGQQRPPTTRSCAAPPATDIQSSSTPSTPSPSRRHVSTPSIVSSLNITNDVGEQTTPAIDPRNVDPAWPVVRLHCSKNISAARRRDSSASSFRAPSLLTEFFKCAPNADRARNFFVVLWSCRCASNVIVMENWPPG